MAYIVTSETNVEDGAVATSTQSIPAGHQANDVLFAFVTQDVGGSNITASGWTVVGTQAAAQAQRTTVLYKVASSSSEADISLSGANDEWVVTIVVVRGADTTTPIHLSDRTDSADSTSSFLDSGTVTTTENNCLILQCWGFDNIFKLVPENPSDLVMLSKETDGVGCVQILGYKNQLTAGATPVTRALSEVSSEGGSCWTIAVLDDGNGKMSPMPTQTYQIVKRYGGITSATAGVQAFIRHDAVTWEQLGSIATTTINGTNVLDHVFTEANAVSAAGPWGTYTAIAMAVAGSGRWVGATHAIASTDMTGKIFSIEMNTTAIVAGRFGIKGMIVYFQDSSNEWAAFTFSPRAGLSASTYTLHIDPETTTPLDQSGSIDWSDITRVAYMYHRTGTNTSSYSIRVKNALLHTKLIVVDGSDVSPISPSTLGNMLEGWGPIGLGVVQGNGQLLIRTGVQIGTGSRKSYYDASASSHELPLRENSSIKRRFWKIGDLNASADYRIKCGATDTFRLTSCVLATDTEQNLIIDSASSPSATYDFSGASIIGWKITNNVSGIAINDANISNCDITLNGGSLEGCAISALKSPLITNDPENITNCEFTSKGTGHAIELTATGTFGFTSNTFVGYGADASTDAVIYNNSGGAVTLNLPLGATYPTVRNGVGATTTILSPTFITVELTGSDTVEMRRNSDDTVLETRTGSGQIDAKNHIGETVYLVRVNGGRDVASSSPTTYTIALGDNGTVPLYVGAEVQVGNIDSIPNDVWSHPINGKQAQARLQGAEDNSELASFPS